MAAPSRTPIAPEDRHGYCADLLARVEALSRRMEELERHEEPERLERPGHAPGPELERLQAQHADLQRALDRCQFAEQDDWISARDEAESAFGRVETALETALARWRGRGTGGS